jgi:uncharacterized protein YbaR (Trm112 family)
MLRCPEDYSALAPVPSTTISEINRAIRAGQLRNRAGNYIEKTIEEGLIRSGGDIVYPIVDGIPVLVRDEGIPLQQNTSTHKRRSSATS